MDTTTRETVIREVKLYSGKAINGYSYFTSSEDGTLLSVISLGQFGSERIADAGLIVRLVGDCIIIDHDINSKPLVDALLQAGIPREQIILAYMGEPVPETP